MKHIIPVFAKPSNKLTNIITFQRIIPKKQIMTRYKTLLKRHHKAISPV